MGITRKLWTRAYLRIMDSADSGIDAGRAFVEIHVLGDEDGECQKCACVPQHDAHGSFYANAALVLAAYLENRSLHINVRRKLRGLTKLCAILSPSFRSIKWIACDIFCIAAPGFRAIPSACFTRVDSHICSRGRPCASLTSIDAYAVSWGIWGHKEFTLALEL